MTRPTPTPTHRRWAETLGLTVAIFAAVLASTVFVAVVSHLVGGSSWLYFALALGMSFFYARKLAQ